jgi:hypothetical protein
MHDVTVLDTAIRIMKDFEIPPEDIQTEKQLHQQNGFSNRTHHPDIIFTRDNKTYCVEMELSLKAKDRLEKNIKSNFLKYDIQIWVVNNYSLKLVRILKEFKEQYPNIKITTIKEVENGTFRIDN